LPGVCERVPMEGGDSRVQVFARSRPLDQREAVFAPCVEVDVGASSVKARSEVEAVDRVSQGHITKASVDAIEAHNFAFDGVFGPQATQQEVFEKVGHPVLKGCLQGLNGTILAYGQTGTGKTYSLQHRGQASDQAGLLPRLVASLYVHVAQDIHFIYEVEAAAVQIYNEQVDDLLHSDRESGVGFALSVQNGGCVPGLTWVRCSRPEVMLQAFQRARSNLVYAETKMNKASSRSHAVFQISITRRPRTLALAAGSVGDEASLKVECTRARLNIVDLAGSERVKKSQVEGVHLKEAVAINKSLLVFGNVVSALAAKRAHVPFRESKLTRILDGSVGGNCRTSLLVCLSPAAENAAETFSTLEFASRAMRVVVDAKVNREVVDVLADDLVDDLCGNLGDIITASLREELVSLQLAVSAAKQMANEEVARRLSTASVADEDAKQLREDKQRLKSCVESKEEELKQARTSEGGLRSSLEAAQHRIAQLELEVGEKTNKVTDLEASAESSAVVLSEAAKVAADLEHWRTCAEARAEELAQVQLSTDEERIRFAEELTKSKDSEEELRTSVEELRGRIDELMAEVRHANQKASDLDASKMAELAEVAVDLKNWRICAEARAKELAEVQHARDEAIKRAEHAEAELESELEVVMVALEDQGEREAERQREAEELAMHERSRSAEKLAAVQADVQAWRQRAVDAEARAATLSTLSLVAAPASGLFAAAKARTDDAEEEEEEEERERNRSRSFQPPRRHRHSSTSTCRAPAGTEGMRHCDALIGPFDGSRTFTVSGVVPAC